MDRTSKRQRPRRFGTAIKDDEDGNHPQAVYAGCFECAGRDAARRTHAETENAFVASDDAAPRPVGARAHWRVRPDKPHRTSAAAG